jgi:uncharacterized protein YlxW (UPF0749 family)
MRRIALLATTLILGIALARLAGGAGALRGVLFGGNGAVVPTPEELLTGRTAVTGPGLRINIDDVQRQEGVAQNPNRLLVHAQDLLLIRNELFVAGAEAVAINGERMTGASSIRCVGPVIRVNDRIVSPPYAVTAIGDPATMKSAVMMMGGVIDLLSMMKMRVDVIEEKRVVMPAYRAMSTPRFARRGGGRP